MSGNRLRDWIVAVRNHSVLRHDRSGSTATSFAIAAPVLLSAVGVGTDISIAVMKKSELQTLADQAAIAAAHELALKNPAVSVIENTAIKFVDANVRDTNRTIEKQVDVSEDKSSVNVKLTESWSPYFAHFIGFEVTPISASAGATFAGQSNICILALEDTSPSAVHLDNSAKINANNCGVYSNSQHSWGVRLDAESSVSASMICSAGGVKAQKNATQPEPVQDCPSVQDPLASRMPPPIESCRENRLQLSSGRHTLSPGNYCRGIKISGTAEVVFEPGTYVISDGPFEISGNAKVTGNYAGFYLSGRATLLKFLDQASIDLKGAKTGDMAGLLFFEERAAGSGRVHRIRSSNVNELTGTIYLPRGTLKVDPYGTVGEDSTYTAIIANALELAEGPTLVLNADYSETDVPVPAGIKSSATVVLSE
jgi:Flp pilus assembly protein TadG